jgi:tricorn protease
LLLSWRSALETLEAEKLTGDAASDMQPMWHGETLYFLSDRGDEQRLNLWARELARASSARLPISRATTSAGRRSVL